MESTLEELGGYYAAKALLDWQVELGVSEAIGDAPVNRYELPPPPEKKPAASAAPPGQPATPELPPQPAPPGRAEMVAAAKAAAANADTPEALEAALASFEHCELRRGARNLVFADGHRDARVMIIGEAPGREEDRAGQPFAGPALQLLDRMIGAIGLSRGAPDPGAAVYLSTLVPWRPPQDREPSGDEIAMLAPFALRHIELIGPDFVVLMGNVPCAGLLGRAGISRMRGQWAEVAGRPALPMFAPAHLMRRPEHKREAWADLLDLQARMRPQ